MGRQVDADPIHDGADERQVEQFVDRGERELGVLFRGQGVQTVARLGTDHDA